MTLLNGWILFGLIPIYLIYNKQQSTQKHKQTKLLYISLALMFLAIARPAYENSYVKQNFNSRDYIIAIDASYSMQADDLKPSRYILSKEAIKRLIHQHPKDRFTLFAFTSSTLLISPPTTDTEISLLALDALNPKYILTKSTNLKNLLKRIATLSQKEKNLIIFSDGGDEHDIHSLAKIVKRNNIILYIVATATQKGTALKKDGRYIKDVHESIVISKINPMLVDLANATGGKYYELTSLNSIDQLSNDIASKKTDKEQIRVRTYRELFYIPLSLAIVLYFLSITKIAQRFLYLIPLFVLMPNKTQASLFDFYYLKEAHKQYEQKHYKKAAYLFEKIEPSTKSYYDIASAYYKAGYYRDAVKFYTQIQTQSPQLKQKILYNLGNCAAKLKHYEEAKQYYVNTLAFGYDADALYNLSLIRKLKLKNAQDISKIMPTKNKITKQKSNVKKENKKNKKNGKSKKSSNRSGNKHSNGSGSSKSSQQTLAKIKKNNTKKSHYKFTYKAYEKINKGYTDEKEPW